MDSLLEDGRARNVDLGCSHDELRSAVLAHAPALDAVSVPRLVHWDAWDSNFFVKDNAIVGLIDFERALWADPLMEAQFRRRQADTMRGYGKGTFTVEEEQRCRLYTLHLGLVMRTECAYRNYDTDYVYDRSGVLLRESMDWLTAS
jgi:aminoglycoside phosphotransferase (APT) family kinase protein